MPVEHSSYGRNPLISGFERSRWALPLTAFPSRAHAGGDPAGQRR